ncbi:MAG TPA: SH3-like domain-containing protein [Afifellaceae bacterium]|nr:SH3-like domain-containing protein [Afifellaceae bacterium]
MSAEPRFAPGDRVVIRDLGKPGHVRTPRYARDKAGVVERFCGAFHNPEESAYGRPAPPVPLYRVRLSQAALWPDYAGPATDTLELEIYEHWLAPASDGGRPR